MPCKIKKLESNVSSFLDRCSSIVGRSADDDFNIGHFHRYLELGMESPIEKIFYTAFNALIKINYIEESDVFHNSKGEYVIGMHLQPQYKVDKFRVDFLAEYHPKPYYFNLKDEDYNYKRVIVECDSQQFHDRSEQERRYEKARDRFLQSSGYTVFRFTGSEICKEAFRCASEVICYLTGDDFEDMVGSIINYEGE